MENASKALIIAGAILISILLISVGIIIMNSTGSVTDQVGSQADSMAIQTFNGQFTSYEGSNKSASQVRSLQSAVNASNASNSHQVTLSGTLPTLNNTSKYTISFTYGTSGNDKGYITTYSVTTP